jgi:hypothetical protein
MGGPERCTGAIARDGVVEECRVAAERARGGGQTLEPGAVVDGEQETPEPCTQGVRARVQALGMAAASKQRSGRREDGYDCVPHGSARRLPPRVRYSFVTFRRSVIRMRPHENSIVSGIRVSRVSVRRAPRPAAVTQ